MFDFYFSGDDDLKNIYSAQRDIIPVFTEVMLKEFPSLEVNNFYRPMVILSHKLDYSIWKLNPFGYHLTSLLIHISVSVLVFFLVRLLTGGKQVTAWLSAVVFTTHPINFLIKNTAQRTDTMAALFLTLSLLLFLKNISGRLNKRFLLTASIVSYVLAFFSKETAIILPFLILTYLIIFSNETLPAVRAINAMKKATPYFIVTLILVTWRAYVLKGVIGGYSNVKHGVSQIISGAPEIVLSYLSYLFNPANFFESFSYNTKVVILFLISSFAFLLFYKWSMHDRRRRFFPISTKGKLLIFLYAWLLLPLGIYVTTSHFARWYMYMPVIPFSIIVSVTFIESLQALKEPSRSSLFKHLSPVVTGILILTLFLYSPFRTIREFRGVNVNVKTMSMFLEKFLEIVREFPDSTTITINNIPENVADISGVGLKLWLNVAYPANKVKDIYFNRGSPVLTTPDYIDFEKQEKANRDMEVKAVIKTRDVKVIH